MVYLPTKSAQPTFSVHVGGDSFAYAYTCILCIDVDIL